MTFTTGQTFGVAKCAVEECSRAILRHVPGHKYCSEHAREISKKIIIEHGKRRAVKKRSAGVALSGENRSQIARVSHPDLIWKIGFKYPFSYALSKNNMLRRGVSGRPYTPSDYRAAREAITGIVVRLLEMYGRTVAKNKVWIRIFVEKPSARGDAVNVIDLVCDALKDGLGIDDNMFSLQQVDWAVVKEDPQIIVEFGQETNEDGKVCASCGHIRALSQFGPAGKKRLQQNCRVCESGANMNV